jgi:Arc/MetJ-type ribon-helix-helix transcriptional regulator
MADTEKISINLSAVDLVRIDLLVEQGFFASRVDFFHKIVRDKLEIYRFGAQQLASEKEISASEPIYNVNTLFAILPNNHNSK